MIDILNERSPLINVCRYYDLLNYDFNMGLLYTDLKNYIDYRFPDGYVNFGNNERLVFLHCDHDFFVNNSSPGFTLYNLQLILRELNIPNYFCRIISHLPNYQKYTDLACNALTRDPASIKAITSVYTKLTPTVNNIELHSTKIKKLFSIGSRLSRFHRTYFMSQIFDKKLEDYGFINYYNIADANDNINQVTDSIIATQNNNPCHFLYSVPFSRHCPEIVVKNTKNRTVVDNFQKSTLSYSNCTPLNIISNKTNSVSYQWLELQNSLIYVGLEAAINCPEPYNDEIGFKSIGIKRPFILFGTPGLLSHLRSLGFKTFNDFWDEGYDNINDMEDRVDAITLVLSRLSNRSVNDLQQMAADMGPILEYNFDHLKNILPQQEFNKIIAGII